MAPPVIFTAAVLLTLPNQLAALHQNPGNISTPAAANNGALPRTLESCLGATGASVVYATDAGYSNLTVADNSNYHPHPQAVVIPNSTEQVAATVRCVAAEQGRVTLTTRGGGHGYAAYSLSGQVVIDSSQMTDIALDVSTQEVTVQMGQKLGPLALAMGRAGYALPHGTCPGVGVAGHSLGGGWGFTSREWGWLVDRVVSLELVDVTGRIRTISPKAAKSNTTSTDDENDDLWWALRGAGSNNFGIVTSFTYRMEPAPTAIVNYNIGFATQSDCVQVLLTLQEIGSLPATSSAGFPTSLGGELIIDGGYQAPKAYCTFTGQYLGDSAAYNKTIDRLLSPLARQSIQPLTTTSSIYTNWVSALTNLMGDLDSPSVPQPYYAKSLFDDGHPNYTSTSIASIFSAIQPAGPDAFISFDLNGPDAVTTLPPDDTVGPMAFNHRNNLFMSQIYAWDFPGFTNASARETAVDRLSDVADAVRQADPEGGWQAYQNYIDPYLQDWAEMYYGDALDRLKEIKKKWDPLNILDFPQGLGRA
ncbi:6-hydroxy-D-nicotine oxidase [Aspergillus costaricaensis CBS 115574]|uniref:6-hydroxy-D-nicotine oxidase n=1 Tax=Aspergillus costaricaensis CBS 115574 TaxID=1448317 RepID=A0ACD1IEK7_9EURO|nr:6-hydroxy-D-nicotine oxidase [Aspergillus costaricaensis CBS 115574]RAK89008.1 6-hydroxy-D-nicotine oxidase [Aspergillus costaricaensis CBS 115574]